MNQIKLLKDVINGMHALADSLDAMAAEWRVDSKEKQTTATTSEPSLSEVREILVKKSQAGFTKEIKALLLTYGAKRLSDIKPEHYGALLKDVEDLG